MLFIQLFFLLATIGSSLSAITPTGVCNQANLYKTERYGTDEYGSCRRYWLCMKMAAGSYAWIEEKCMGTMYYDGTACVVNTHTTPAGCITITTTTPPTTTTIPTIPPSTCNAKTLYTTKAAPNPKDPKDKNHYWLCMKSSSGGYEWVYEKCMGTLVYQDGTCEVSTTSPKKPGYTLAYNP